MAIENTITDRQQRRETDAPLSKIQIHTRPSAAVGSYAQFSTASFSVATLWPSPGDDRTPLLSLRHMETGRHDSERTALSRHLPPPPERLNKKKKPWKYVFQKQMDRMKATVRERPGVGRKSKVHEMPCTGNEVTMQKRGKVIQGLWKLVVIIPLSHKQCS